MDHYRRTAHTRYDLKYHFVWITKYRKKLLRADVAVRLRQLVPGSWAKTRHRFDELSEGQDPVGEGSRAEPDEPTRALFAGPGLV
jgi:REP element-mobilizing transposase RayT